MNKAYKYRIYPNKKQIEMFSNTFGSVRFVYNKLLNIQEESNTYMSKVDSNNYCNRVLKIEYPWLKEVDKFSLTNSIFNLNEAYKRYFNKLSNRPVYKSKRYSRNSYTTNFTNNNIEIGEDYIKLPKVKKVKAKIHRLPNEDWKIKQATISKQSDNKYYVSILFEYEKEIINNTIDTSKSIGLDYASNGLYVDDLGNVGSNHKYFKESKNKLAKLQRRLAKKQGSKKGETKSNNYLKQQAKVNKLYSHIANQRNDNLHKLSYEIANHYDIVCVEDLDMKALSNKGFGNGLATLDNGYGLFLKYLEYKLNDRNKQFIKVDKFFPSTKTCSCCGNIVKSIPLSQRTYFCDVCGNTLDRDINAAINIKKEGLRLLNLQNQNSLNTILQ